MVIKSLFLDADGVLFKKISPVVNCEIERLTETENAKEIIWRYWNPVRIGKITSKEMWLGGSSMKNYEDGVFEELGISPLKYNSFIERLENSYEYFEGAEKFLKKVSETGIDMYLLSNSSYDFTEKQYDNLGTGEYVSFPFYSHKMGVAKPDREIYYTALARTNSSIPNSMFVDDKIKNINTANEIGMHTKLFTREKDFESILDKLY